MSPEPSLIAMVACIWAMPAATFNKGHGQRNLRQVRDLPFTQPRLLQILPRAFHIPVPE